MVLCVCCCWNRAKSKFRQKNFVLNKSSQLTQKHSVSHIPAPAHFIIAHFPFDSIAMAAEESEHMFVRCEKIARLCALKMPQWITINVCVKELKVVYANVDAIRRRLRHLVDGKIETRKCEGKSANTSWRTPPPKILSLTSKRLRRRTVRRRAEGNVGDA